MTTYAPRPIVVGLDGSAHSSHALDWAIGEARNRRLPLHLLHALHTGTTSWSPLMAQTADVDDQRRILEGALHHVRTTAPEVPVTSTITSGPASVALEDASAEADTLVVGASSRGAIESVLLGSTLLHVIGHARSPVVVVREEPGGTEMRPAGHVVVGFDGSYLSDDALAYAFTTASQAHLPLDILTAWDTAELVSYQLAPTIAEEVRATADHHRHELAAAAAAPWGEKYPDVDYTVHVTTDSPAQALIDRSRNATLVVIGSRGLGSVRGALVGSVSAHVLRHAHSPVAVIPPKHG